MFSFKVMDVVEEVNAKIIRVLVILKEEKLLNDFNLYKKEWMGYGTPVNTLHSSTVTLLITTFQIKVFNEKCPKTWPDPYHFK